jgi:chemotaxis protein MotB
MVRWMIAGSVALALTGCGVDEEIHNKTVADLNHTKQMLADCQKTGEAQAKDLAAQKEQQSKLEWRLAQLGQERGSLTVDLAKANKRMEELRKAEAAAEARAAQFRELVSKFKSMIDAGKLQVEVRDGRMLVKLPDSILFDPGKTDLKQGGKDALVGVAQVLKDIKDRKYQIAGHTDNVPIKSKRFADNWELSAARALEVVHFLIAQGGMDAKTLSAAGYADQLPVAPNDTPENKQKNRRIEIVLQPNLEDLPPIEESSGGAAQQPGS